jgi:hypothetical protein
MIATWMAYALLVSLLLALAGRGLEELIRVAGGPQRFVWLGALVAVAVLVALAPIRASAPAGLDPIVEVSLVTAVEDGSAVSGQREAGAIPFLASLGDLEKILEWPLHALALRSSESVGRVLGGAWLILSMILLALGAASLRHFGSLRRGWHVRDVAGVRARVSPTVGPAVMGVFRPEIVVPEWLLSSPAEAQRLVMLHEQEHLRARDTVTLAGGFLTVALLPWNPVAWWMLRRLRLAIELDCDRRVLRRGGVRPRVYGSMLIDFSGREGGLFAGVPVCAGTPSTLERRLLLMTAKSSRFGAIRATAVGIGGAAVLLAACETKMPTAAEVERMDVTAIEAQARQLRVLSIDGGETTYYVDGREVSADEARAIAGDRIAQMEIMRPSGGEGARIHLRVRGADESIELLDGVPGSGDGSIAVATVRMLADGEPGGPMLLRSPRSDAPSAGAAVAATENFNGLLLIDGVRSTPLQLRRLPPERIQSVEVIKGDAAQALYPDPAAADGVIRITTKP